MSTKPNEILNPESCWNKAADDEPLFVLRANDELAPNLVIMWASKYQVRKGGYAAMTDRQRAKFHEALQLAQQMRDWKAAKLATDEDIPF